MTRLPWAIALAALASCGHKPEPVARAGSGSPSLPLPPLPTARLHDGVSRVEFNRWAVRRNLPVYWTADANANDRLDPGEVVTLLFYPTAPAWVVNGAFTPAFEAAYDAIVAASKAAASDPVTPDSERRRLVGRELDQGRPTLVHTDFSTLSADERGFVNHMLRVATLVDQLYDGQSGAGALAAKLPADPESRSMFRRNRGPQCVAPATEKQPACSAIPGSPKPVFSIYPAELQQAGDAFCKELESRGDASQLLAPFVAVRGSDGAMAAVPYTVAYKDEMRAIADELTAAADAVKDPSERALVDYLRAAAVGFTTNDWNPADEAWSKMTVDNSKWYVRVAPDETYWEPCSHKAGVHLTFARINQGSKQWQSKLVPVQQDMEAAIAQRAGKPYVARKVTFHLPDFIDIVVNAGDDRHAFSPSIGQSLPNWGPVASEGRGRTVAMVNLYTDPDSLAARRAQAESVLDAASMQAYSGDASPGLMSTILHEATHNLGPSHDYKVKGKTAPELFTGPVAQLLEELKAQAGSLFLVEFLRARHVISDELAVQSYVDTVVWGFGHISQGMYEADGKRKTYSQVAAIQNGFLIERGALVWDPKAIAANGKDLGAFRLERGNVVAVVDDLMKLVAGIKSRGDNAAAVALIKKFVDGAIVPHATIVERYLRFPKPSFVFAITM